MDLFLTEDDYLPEELDELPLDEAILRLAELDDERAKTKKSRDDRKGKRKRPREEDDGEIFGTDEDEEEGDGGGESDGDADDDSDNGDDNDVKSKDDAEIFGPSGAESKKDDEDGKKEKKKPRRKLALGPRVLLNEERLRHPQGIAALPGIQSNMKFKGKGHEEEDLAMVMATMEAWSHNLMPKISFGDFIKKAEELGRKRSIKAFMYKLRHDEPLNTVKRNSLGELDLSEVVVQESDEEFELSPVRQVTAEDAFDALMREAGEDVAKRALSP